MDVVHFDTEEMFVVLTDIKKNAPKGRPEGAIAIDGHSFSVTDGKDIWKARSPIHFPIRMGFNINLLWTIIRGIVLHNKKARWLFPESPIGAILFLTEDKTETYLLMPIRLSE